MNPQDEQALALRGLVLRSHWRNRGRQGGIVTVMNIDIERRLVVIAVGKLGPTEPISGPHYQVDLDSFQARYEPVGQGYQGGEGE